MRRLAKLTCRGIALASLSALGCSGGDTNGTNLPVGSTGGASGGKAAGGSPGNLGGTKGLGADSANKPGTGGTSLANASGGASNSDSRSSVTVINAGGSATATNNSVGGSNAVPTNNPTKGGAPSSASSPSVPGTNTKGGSNGLGGAATSRIVGSGGNTIGGASATGGMATTRASGGALATGGQTTSSVSGGGASNPSSSTTNNSTAACVAKTAVAAMKFGWNLGNTLDSVDTSKSDQTVETAWGNPVVTSTLMKGVATAGFGAVRIPVTWIGRFGAAPSYTINSAFIKRVEEVAKYALDLNLYVIINIHHDGGYNVNGRWINIIDSSGAVTSANTSAVVTQFKAIWKQIADYFKSYGDHLIFEGMNEVMVDYNTPKTEYYGVINTLNQAFVDTVRASSGFNPNRCLVVPGYNTNIDYTVAGFVAPKDTSSGKLILSDHYYDPYDFSGAAKTHAWGAGNPGVDSWGQEDAVRSQFAKLKSTFIDKDLPMILGEYGAVNQTGYENYRRYYVEYVTKAAHDVGIAPFFWDNGSTKSGSEGFGLINRNDGTVMYQPIVDAIKRAATSSYTLDQVAKP